MKILQIMFRPEGVDLLADIYIEKIKKNLREGDKKSALNNMNTIWDYELNEEKGKILEDLKKRI